MHVGAAQPGAAIQDAPVAPDDTMRELIERYGVAQLLEAQGAADHVEEDAPLRQAEFGEQQVEVDVGNRGGVGRVYAGEAVPGPRLRLLPEQILHGELLAEPEGVVGRCRVALLGEASGGGDHAQLLQLADGRGDHLAGEARPAIQGRAVVPPDPRADLGERDRVPLFLEAENAPHEVEQHLERALTQLGEEGIEVDVGDRGGVGRVDALERPPRLRHRPPPFLHGPPDRPIPRHPAEQRAPTRAGPPAAQQSVLRGPARSLPARVPPPTGLGEARRAPARCRDARGGSRRRW